jgi:2-polyprenyl-6-methoxyphenol hydroxylase-like FAD-dependent oxidoreductase
VAAVRRVVIVGAGVAGPTLALALHRLGIEAELVEGQQVWGPVGVGLTLMGPALRALRTIGLLDRAVADGAPLSRFAVGNASTEVTSVEELPRLNGPEYPSLVQLSRPAFHTILADAVRAAGLPVRLGVTVDAIRPDEAGELEVRLSDGERTRCDLVVGADGVHSQVRALMFPEVPKPRFTGQAVWRAMVDRPDGFASIFEEGTMYMFYGPDNKAGVVPTSSRQLYIFLVQNIDGRSRPPTERLPELLRAQLDGYGGFLGVLRDRITSPSQVVWRALEVLLVPPPWYRGSVVLIGDAAHTTTPHLASGAGIAIEDAIVLADELSSHERLGEALDAFMARRYERCRMVVENSARLGEWEKHAPPDADPVGLTSSSWAALALPV